MAEPTRTDDEFGHVPEKYRELIAGLLAAHPDAAEKAYLRARFLDAAVGARRSMKRDQRLFRRVNVITLGAGAVSPVLVTATAAMDGGLDSVLTISAICSSLVAAVGGVLLQTLRPGIRWRLHRTLRDELEALGWLRLAAVATSPQPADRPFWSDFVHQVESAIKRHNDTYAAEVAGSLGSGPVGTETDGTRSNV